MSFDPDQWQPPQQKQNSFTTANSQKFSAGSASALSSSSLTATNPLVAVAHQKARYAHVYVPPPALQRSRLPASAVSGTDQKPYHAFTQPTTTTINTTAPPQWQQRAARDFDGAHSRSSGGGGGSSQIPRSTAKTTTQLPPSQTSPMPSPQCFNAFLAVQERQLRCWQQLSDTQQLLALHLRGLEEELRRMNATLAGPVLSCLAASVNVGKRSRCGECPASLITDATPAALTTKTAAAPPPLPMGVQLKDPQPQLHAVRLLGETATITSSTTPDGPLCVASPPRKAGDPRTSHLGASFVPAAVRDSEVSQRSTEAADSEADIFML